MITPEERHAAPILIVDDEDENLHLLRSILAEDGYEQLECLSDSRQVVERYVATKPALVVLDIGMPHLDGFAVLEQLKQVETDGLLSVLVLTGRGDVETRLKALDSGAKDFLGKPFNVPEVLVRIRNMLETRMLTERMSEQNRALEERVTERTAELRASQLEVVYRLAMAAERRDLETGHHIIRMSRYCGLVAEAGGFPPEDVELLLNAAPLHDVGKIGVPDAILLKPGALTPEEWVIMRSHTTIGADMLRGGTTGVMRTGRAIALSHHERWDGSGYPEGLAGVDIPLVARIAAVCDVFDAVTSDRCYHRAMDIESGIRVIRDAAGRHFDPNVVAWFERALPAIQAVPRRADRGH